MSKGTALLLLILVISIPCHGQERTGLSVSLENAKLISLIDQIEAQTEYRFYFIESWFDTVRVTASSQNEPVPVVLKNALSKKGIYFFIQQNKIILTAGIRIDSTIEESIFRSGSGISTTRFTREIPKEQEVRDPNTQIEIGKRGNTNRKSFTITGYIRENRSGEPLPGAVILVKGTNNATTSDPFGFYSITLSGGESTLSIQLIGMETINQKINVLGDGKLDFKMIESVVQLKELIVESEVDRNVANVQMGTSRIDVRTMKNIPKILGENDLFKVAIALPGVKSVGEGASGLNVRGGHADQNLVILNEATIYNTSHFLGFFSIFNPDAIRSFELYKSAMPVQYGGRLSSTFELLMRDGNNNKISAQGGIGPITSHITLEVPLVKDKTTLLIGGRSTYSNWVLRMLPDSQLKNTSASFYDAFARVTHNLNDRNTIYLSLYGSRDKFNLSSDTLFSYRNKLASFQWRRVFTPDVDAVFSITHSRYDYSINYNTKPYEAFDMGFAIAESNAKIEFNHSKGKHKFTYGGQMKLYDLNPGFVDKASDSSLVRSRKVDAEKGVESAIFVADNFDISQNLSFYLGLRYSTFAALGPATMYEYSPGLPKSENTVVDSVTYGSNDVVKAFHGPEYRMSMRYKISDKSAIKLSYNRTRQYIHMLSNTVSVSPTDTWKLSDQNIHPQVADQISAGFYRNLKQDLEISFETYFKWIDNILDYKTGAKLLVNEHLDQQAIQGVGKAYGFEVLLRKKSGIVTGWIGYTYSRTFERMTSPIASEQINRGEYFPTNYDKPHDLSIITNYKITRRYSFSFNLAYSTGRPITYPVAAYRFGNNYRVNYSDRNAYRIPDYFRIDLGFNIEGNHKIKKLAHGYWSISIYNLLGRRNPYSVYYKVEDEKIKAYKLSVFGAPIPTVTYHFKF